MKRSHTALVLLTMLLPVVLAGRWMDEGMWLLDSLHTLPLPALKSSGLELTPEQIFSSSGPSLKDAIVQLGGGTAAFVSPEGLMVTNHHVAFGGIQQLSSVQDDYLKNGFLARARQEELSTSYTGQVLVGMNEVTAEVLAAVRDGMDAGERARAIAVVIAQLEKQATDSTDEVCRVAEMWNGVRYYLFRYRVFRDVRLVYAPPGAIGNYGGQTDNWMWPRHTGDFALMRAYVGRDGKPARYSPENTPFVPAMYLPISTAGYAEGTFAMIMGYPGRTYRYQEAAAIQLAYDETLPLTAELYRIRMDAMESAWKNDRALQIKLAARWRRMANTYKNIRGTLEGLRRTTVLTQKRMSEAAFATYLKSSLELTARYGTLLRDFEEASTDLRRFNRKSILLSNLASGVEMYRLAARFRQYAASRDSAAAHPTPQEDGRTSLNEFTAGVFKTYDAGVDRNTLVALILKWLEQPPDQHLVVFSEAAAGRTGTEREDAVREFVGELYEDSRLSTPEGAQELARKEPVEIREDPFVKLAAAVQAESGPLTARTAHLNARISLLRARYAEAGLAWQKSRARYPDANRTLRLTYGTVKSLNPRDAVSYSYMTTLTGVMEKETGEGDFVVPTRLRELWTKKDFGRYADPATGDIPVAFISNLDITGGNSGSPVINGKGEFIGCAFDGNWEGVVGDYVFEEPLNRTISVDARYMLFVLEKFSGASHIVAELTVR